MNNTKERLIVPPEDQYLCIGGINSCSGALYYIAYAIAYGATYLGYFGMSSYEKYYPVALR